MEAMEARGGVGDLLEKHHLPLISAYCGTYDFKAHKDDIVATLNEVGKAVTDMGLTPVLHQHTGTCVETRDETYAVMEAVDTRVMKFGPDIGSCKRADRIRCGW
jgi:inosose dehydratase